MARSGLAYAPELEWDLAARWWGYTPEQFADLPGEIQSRRIAGYRIHHHAEAVVAKEQARQARRNQPKG